MQVRSYQSIYLYFVQWGVLSACSGNIHAAVSVLEGVQSASVSLLGNSMAVIHDPLLAPELKIIDTVSDCGYGAEVWKREEVSSHSGNDAQKLITRTVQVLIEGFCE